MAVEVPILQVEPTERGEPPLHWCLPTWFPLVASWDQQFGKTFIKTACRQTPECEVPPEQLRQQVERGLRKLSAWGGKRLTLDAYTVARNIQSEFGDGSPSERAAIALVAANRTRNAGSPSITAHIAHHTTGRYGKQVGSIRPASTAQDPSVANILLADLVVRGAVRDFTNGATHYFDRVTQDFMSRKSANSPPGEELYLDWTAGGDFLTWLGHMPGIRPWRLALLKRRPDLKPRAEDTPELKAEKVAARSLIRAAGQQAVMGLARAPAPWDSCLEAIGTRARQTVFGLGDPELAALEDREGLAVAGFCLFMAGVAGLAAGSLGTRRRRTAPNPG